MPIQSSSVDAASGNAHYLHALWRNFLVICRRELS